MKHFEHSHEPPALPGEIHKIRVALSKLKKDDVEAYRPLAEDYKVATIEFASRRKKYLRQTFNMALTDVCVRACNVPLAAASRELAVALGLRALQHYPKMVFRALRVMKIATSRSTLEFARESGMGNLEKQIGKVISFAEKREKKLQEEEKKSPKAAALQVSSHPSRARLTVQSGGRVQARSAQPAHK